MLVDTEKIVRHYRKGNMLRHMNLYKICFPLRLLETVASPAQKLGASGANMLENTAMKV
jgi:hypothetical protein